MVNCVECYTPRLMFEHILNHLSHTVPAPSNDFASYARCDNMTDFVRLLAQLLNDSYQGAPAYIVRVVCFSHQNKCQGIMNCRVLIHIFNIMSDASPLRSTSQLGSVFCRSTFVLSRVVFSPSLVWTLGCSLWHQLTKQMLFLTPSLFPVLMVELEHLMAR